jgi:hypothetical protein
MLKSSSRRLFSRHAVRVQQHVPNMFEKDGNFRLPDGRRSAIEPPRKETQFMTLPCAKSVYPNAFSRQHAKPEIIIQDVAE